MWNTNKEHLNVFEVVPDTYKRDFVMKECIIRMLFAIFLLVSPLLSISAQDILVFKNGDVINAVVKEVAPAEIKYQKTSNISGPIYTVAKKDVVSIKYSNGETEKFDLDSVPDANNDDRGKQTHSALVADDNDSQKRKYSMLPLLNVTTSNKKSSSFFPIMAFTDSSVISTKDLLITINPNPVKYYEGGWKVKLGYAIQILNKTDAPIYIDRALCFRIDNELNAKSYFDNKTYTVNSGNSKGIGVAFVGIGLGGSSFSSNSENFGVDRFLVIGPKAKANLVDYKYIRLSETKAKFKTVSDVEYWGFNLASTESVNQGAVKTYTEKNTPYSNRYFITYLTDPQFSNKLTVNFELFAKYLVGAEIKQWRWAMTNPADRIVGEIKQAIPDFGTNSFVIIGMNGEYIK